MEIPTDIDKYTVIVKNIADFTDPGVSFNGTTVYGSAPVAVADVEGLYTVTYTLNTGLSAPTILTRYVMEAGRIGDVNGDGYVNAVDANFIEKALGANTTINAEGVKKARVWDVNKDGQIDASDASAIRSRYRTKLMPYYPWIAGLDK